MQTAVILILLLVCAALVNAIAALERGMRRAREQIREQMEDETTVRLNVPCPNDAAEDLFRTVNELLELRQAERADARRKEQELRRQIADVSHDLRTPLTSILGYLQLLEDEGLSPAQRAEYLAVIRGRAATLQSLITSFYDLSLAEGGQWKLEREPVDLARVVADQLSSAYEQIEAAGLRVSADIPAGLPPVWGDRRGVVRVVSNLLTNALKHGSGSLNIRLYREGEHVISLFANDAPGMAPEDAARVFQRSYTGDPARAGQDAGLGLAIVKALTARMDCQATAALDQGRFTVHLVWKISAAACM